ncbi:hypothetical protein [Glycomyces harbinensis]|uniref:Uncharacterized protein n=1 Tax=Glycomyces harbinensis TaxID=58114 RepID=A0A1G6Y3L5_9ACTN|nr:hypothetical protein [Glycomyces harbinensis]SDD84533.1 hypothetical protein SAMN05216270_10893 [Glycomyces harbinensis]
MGARPPAKPGYLDADDVPAQTMDAWVQFPARVATFGPLPVTAAPTADFVAGDTADVVPEPGRGVIDVLLSTRSGGGAAGVLLVDGAVVGCGDGRYQVQVEPGRRIVEAQGRGAAQACVDIVAGQRVCLTTDQTGDLVSADRHVSPIARVDSLERLRPKGSGSKTARAAGWTLLALAFALFVAATVFTYETADRVGSGPFARVYPTATGQLVFWLSCPAALVVLVCGGFALSWDRTRLQNRVRGSLDFDLGRQEPSGGGTAVQVADGRRHREILPAGATGVLVRFQLRQHRVSAERRAGAPVLHEGDVPDLSAAYAAPPEATVDGFAVPVSWGGWFYPLPPGAHRLAVAADGRFDPVRGTAVHTGETTARGEIAFTVEPGAVADLRVRADVYRVWRPEAGHVESFTPRLDLKAKKPFRAR